MAILLDRFSNACKYSKEYQGDGWGATYYQQGRWQSHHEIRPIWESDLKFLRHSQVVLLHARSASFGEEPDITNNMPFETDRFSFVFNGELRGVRLAAPGRIGAEKIFRFILNFYRGNLEEAIKKAVPIIERRVQYIRAMNFIILDKLEGRFYVYSSFSEDPDYFTMHNLRSDDVVISSDPIPNLEQFPIHQNLLEVI